MNPPNTFDDYVRNSPRAGAAIAHALEQTTTFRSFDRWVLKVMWLHEQGAVVYPESAEGQIARGLIVKMVQECRALLACALAGSSLGTLHHARGVLETWACAHYIFADPASAPKHTARWVNFRQVFQYIHRRSLELALDAQQISQSQFDERCLVPPSATNVSPEQLREWERLYGVKPGELLKVKGWLQGRSYEQLLEAVDAALPTRLELAKQYGYFCHATHPSPLATGLLGGLKLCDENGVNHGSAIAVAAHALHGVLGLLPTEPTTVLRDETRDEFVAWEAEFAAVSRATRRGTREAS